MLNKDQLMALSIRDRRHLGYSQAERAIEQRTTMISLLRLLVGQGGPPGDADEPARLPVQLLKRDVLTFVGVALSGQVPSGAEDGHLDGMARQMRMAMEQDRPVVIVNPKPPRPKTAIQDEDNPFGFDGLEHENLGPVRRGKKAVVLDLEAAQAFLDMERSFSQKRGPITFTPTRYQRAAVNAVSLAIRSAVARDVPLVIASDRED